MREKEVYIRHISEKVAPRYNIGEKKLVEVIVAIFDAIHDFMRDGNSVCIKNFGVFEPESLTENLIQVNFRPTQKVKRYNFKHVAPR